MDRAPATHPGPGRPSLPRLSDVDWSLYPNPYEVPITTSRGCVLNCAFCYETVYWQRFRTQGPERIVAEMEHQIALHRERFGGGEDGRPVGFAFTDGHLGGLRRTAELMVQRRVPATWTGQATINAWMDREFLELVRASGCTNLSFGLESGSKDVLEAMGKRFHSQEAVEFLTRVHDAGISVTANVMVGFPTETRRDFVRTLRFLGRVRRVLYSVNNVGAAFPAPGSRLHRSPEQFGIVPEDPERWESSQDLRWTSGPTGSERDRGRRVRVLHAWMALLRIPHQQTVPPDLPRPVRRAVAPFARFASAEHLKPGAIPPPPSGSCRGPAR